METFEDTREVNWGDPVEENKPKKKTKKVSKKTESIKTKMEVVISSLEVKDWADKEAPTIATIYKGDIVSVGKEEGDYIEVKLTKNISGYSLKKGLR